MRTIQLVSWLLPAVLVAGACGGGGAAKSDAKVEADAKAKAEQKAKEEKELADKLAQKKAEREAKEKEAAEAKAKQEAALAALIALPDKLPKDYVKACDEVGTAQDGLMKRHLQGEALTAWEGRKDGAISMTVVQCAQAESVKVAACQKAALDKAGPEFKDDEAVKSILRACISQFADANKKVAAGVPPRPRR